MPNENFYFFLIYIVLFVLFKHVLLQVNIKKSKTYLIKEINQLQMKSKHIFRVYQTTYVSLNNFRKLVEIGGSQLLILQIVCAFISYLFIQNSATKFSGILAEFHNQCQIYKVVRYL